MTKHIGYMVHNSRGVFLLRLAKRRRHADWALQAQTHIFSCMFMYFHVFLHVDLYVFAFLGISKYTPLPLVVFLHVSLRTSSCRVFINRFWHFAAACHADLFSDFGTGHPQPDYFHIKIRHVAKSMPKYGLSP